MRIVGDRRSRHEERNGGCQSFVGPVVIPNFCGELLEIGVEPPTTPWQVDTGCHGRIDPRRLAAADQAAAQRGRPKSGSLLLVPKERIAYFWKAARAARDPSGRSMQSRGRQDDEKVPGRLVWFPRWPVAALGEIWRATTPARVSAQEPRTGAIDRPALGVAPPPVTRLPALQPGAAQDSALTPEELVNVAVYENVNRSVVNINTKTVRSDVFFLFEAQSEGAGSGSVLDTRGHVLTNYHVVDGAREIQLRYSTAKVTKAGWWARTNRTTWP